jgi:hypothetical protein
MKNRIAQKTLGIACSVVVVVLAVCGKSWDQTSTNSAIVHFKLEGLTPAAGSQSAGPLSATVDPAKTGLGKPPAVVTVTGGRPAYTVTCSNPAGYSITSGGANKFVVTRTKNGVGSVTVTITDSANASTQVKVMSVLTGLQISK